MIVIDENLHDRWLMAAIAAWYPGKVISIVKLRPHSVIKDDAIPALLLNVSHPTFVTINVTDFWRKVDPHPAYCIVNVGLPKERMDEVPELLRRFLHLPEFKTKALRMDKMIFLALNRIRYYEFDRRIVTLRWPT